MAIDVPEESREFINSGFVERLENNSPNEVDVLVETTPGMSERVLSRLREDPRFQITDEEPLAGLFIPATVAVQDVPRLATVEGIELVHQDQLVSIGAEVGGVEIPNPRDNRLRVAAENYVTKLTNRADPFAGGSVLDPVEVPRFNIPPTPAGDPVQALLAAVDNYTKYDTYDDTFIRTLDTVNWVLDTGLTEGAEGAQTQVAVLDTGHTPLQPTTGRRFPQRESFVPGEPAADLHGHGSWVTNTVAGKRHPSPWGTCRGVAPEANVGHFKCLNTFPGFGKTSWIIRAIERALDWGADVISMSLGGPQQGPVNEDPYCRLIRRTCKENAGDDGGAIYVVAVGNSGPDQWSVGSPGVSEKAITVGSYGMQDQAPVAFSSRGPQGEYYKGKPDEFEEDRREFGAEELVKPDVIAPGGGRVTEELRDQSDELLWQAESGWVESFHDGIRDTTGGMAGTSMATPHVAGFCVRLYEAGVIRTAAEFKQVASDRAERAAVPPQAVNATEEVGGKSIAQGFGMCRESVFDPDTGSSGQFMEGEGVVSADGTDNAR